MGDHAKQKLCDSYAMAMRWLSSLRNYLVDSIEKGKLKRKSNQKSKSLDRPLKSKRRNNCSKRAK